MSTPEPGSPEQPPAPAVPPPPPGTADDGPAAPPPFGTPGLYSMPSPYGPPAAAPAPPPEPVAAPSGPVPPSGSEQPTPPSPPGGFLPPAVAGVPPVPAPYGTPAAGAPAGPYAAPPAGPYGAPPAGPYGAPPPGYAGAPAPRSGPRAGLAITALVLAVLGLLPAWIPFLQYVGALLALVALGLGIPALVGAVRGTRGGKGVAIAALAVSLVALLVVGVTHVAYAGIRQDFVDGFTEGWTGAGSDVDPYDYPGLTDPTPDGPPADPVEVVEVAFGQEVYDETSWWYAVVVDNPNPEHSFPYGTFEIQALAADGTVLATDDAYSTVLPGRSALTGVLYEIGDTPVDRLEVVTPDPVEAEHATDLPTVEVSDVTAVSDEIFTTVTGTVTVTGADDPSVLYLRVVVLARAPDGTVVGMATGYVDSLPADGTGEFEATFYDVMAEGTTYESFGSP
ncbi:hypothetical protein [Cellulomonas oligotrophica]|uniref:DUF4190 domain-containing protein n=1 Tax=Cellulomonas oligotrophica TaxID=931536 RepID=A0A7Y9FGH5_9CELL|nr:hypothetical protein [Cellulomonas oligotrophica]NYD86819.1 hypothetical protein [Cellulomonas oligotrophica]GIG32396.1 hypothetical protein Col01nite_15550 [Cellulomonas oligotrophica]